MLAQFKNKISVKSARVGVVGLGYVGLPLAVAFGRAGYSVTGFDIDPKKIKSLTAGKSYILDVRSDEVAALARRGKFRATDDMAQLRMMDAVIICVPTPLRKAHKPKPDMSHIEKSALAMAGHLRRGQLVVLESTTYPGTTDEILAPLLEKSGLKAEKDFFLAFSPERIDPGNQHFETTSIPKIVGGIGPDSLSAAAALYGAIMKTVVPVSSARAAEMAKLLENTFRSVNIALVNEMAMIADILKIDIWEVIEAAKTKPFGFMPFYPGPGIGGHCLPIDPLYLTWKTRQHGYKKKMMIDFASLEINKKMPHYVVERAKRILKSRGISMRGARVLVLGVAYKKDVDDVRESPSVDVMDLLIQEGARVSYVDPYVREFPMGSRRLKSRPLAPSVLKSQALVLLLTNHRAFDTPMISRHSKLILDTRNSLRKYQDPNKGNLFFL